MFYISVVVRKVRLRLPDNYSGDAEDDATTPTYGLTAEYRNGQTECLLQNFQNGDTFHQSNHRTTTNGQAQLVV